VYDVENLAQSERRVVGGEAIRKNWEHQLRNICVYICLHVRTRDSLEVFL
jgi:hypothetical protein